MNETDDLVDALAPVVAVLRMLGIPHFAGGSVASSFHGAARTTMDVDIVCELTEADIEYLQRVAESVGVADLLARLLQES